MRVIQAMPRVDERIFPYNHRSISSRFTRACKVFGIEDLHFHDLRHEGVSRLFEMGETIPHVAGSLGSPRLEELAALYAIATQRRQMGSLERA